MADQDDELELLDREDEDEKDKPQPEPDDKSIGGRIGVSEADSAMPAPQEPVTGTSVTGRTALPVPPAKSVTATPLGGSQPILPPGGATASPMPAMAPPGPSLAPRPAADALARMETQGAPISRKHGVGGGILKALETIGTIVSPGAMAAIPGTRANYALQTRNAANAANQEGKQIQEQDTEGNLQSEEELRRAQIPETGARTKLYEAQAEAATQGTKNIGKVVNGMLWNPATQNYDIPTGNQFKSAQEGYANAVQNAMQRGVDPAKDEAVQHWADAITSTQKDAQSGDFEKFYKDYLTDNNFPDTAHNRVLARKVWAAAAQAPEREPHTLMLEPQSDGSQRVVEAKPGMTISGNATTTGKAGAVPAEVKKSFDTFSQSQERYNVMQAALKPALAGDQQAMLNLLANHLGMTMGLQKGARLNQALITEAQESSPLLKRMEARFDKNGYLTGVTLTPEQMTSMIDLAKTRVSEDKNAYDREVNAAKTGYGMQGNAGGAGGPGSEYNFTSKKGDIHSNDGKTWFDNDGKPIKQ